MATNTATVTSAVPALRPYRIVLGVLVVVMIALGNLRGVRESAQLFAAPTYFFVVSILGMVGYGLLAATFHWLPEAPFEPHPPGLEGIGLFLFLRAYAAGCTALTGVEAVSNGVQALKPPEGRDAAAVMTTLGVLAIVMFLGITYLAYDFGIAPGGDETVVSKIARRVFGTGVFYYAIQARTLAATAAVRGVYVETDPVFTARLEHRWGKWGLGVPLVVLTSPYRSLLRPFLDDLDEIQSRGDDQIVTTVLPEFLPRRWWQHMLHNQTALLIKGALLFRKNTVVADVPYLLRRPRVNATATPVSTPPPPP
jgi:amino acid permease-like protein